MRRGLLALAIISVGCGGGGGGGGSGGNGGGDFSTTLNSNQSVGSLTPSQQTQFCGDLTRFVDSFLARECTALGLVSAEALLAGSTAPVANADLQTACTLAYNGCVQASADAGTGQCDFSQIDATNCTSTISQISTCLDDLVSAEDQLNNGLPSCSSLTSQSLAAALSIDAGTSANPPSCVAFNSTCPGAGVMTTITPGH
jgi:hypothetical protein